MMKLRPYPEYKDSKTSWFGMVPGNWEVTRLGSVLKARGETNESGKIQKVLSVLRDIGVIPYEDKGNIGNKRSEDITRYKIVRPDDIVINCMNVIIGSVGISRYTGCLSPVYYVLVPVEAEANPRYYDYVFKVKPFQHSLIRLGNGILHHRMRIPMELLKGEAVPKPTIQEQRQIVRFLDAKTRLIDRFTRNKRRLIELLQEQKQAVISDCVTGKVEVRRIVDEKGNSSFRLQPSSCKMRDSGIHWFGKIPERWSAIQLGRLCSQILDGPHVSPEYVDAGEGPMFISARNIKVDRWSMDDAKYISWEDYETFSKRVRPSKGDVLYTKGGTTGVARAVDFDDSFQIWVHVAVLKIRQNVVDPFFVAYALNEKACYQQAQLFTRGATNQDLGLNRMSRIYLVLPPLEEQCQIADFLNAKTRQSGDAISHAQRQIDLIQEYRTRLIADVVTGKVDVRGTMVEDVPEDDALEELAEEMGEDLPNEDEYEAEA